MAQDFPNFIDGNADFSVVRPADLAQLFGGLEGRNVFPVSDALGRTDFPDKTVVLRLDAEHGIVSGDLFHDPHDRNWIWSWTSEAIYKPDENAAESDWDFAALCEVHFPESEDGALRRHSKVVLVVRRGEHGGDPVIADFRMALIAGAAKSQDVIFRFDPARHKGNPDKGGFNHFSSFRRINLSVRANAFFRDDPHFQDIMLRAFGSKTAQSPLEAALSEAGLFGTTPAAGRNGEFDSIEFVDVDEEDAPANTIFQSYWSQLSGLADGNSFTYRIFLSAAQDEPGADDIPLGRTIGLEPSVRRSGSRSAAIVFPKEIVASYEAQYPCFVLSEGKQNTAFDEHMNRLAFRLRFTIIHELAHMLNLPHPWQRAAFKESGMRSEPQACSWTNYGSLYPFGAANDHVFQQIADIKTRRKARLARAKLVMEKFLRDARFTSAEKIHLYHAPHDRIAPGGRSFIDAERGDPQMAAPRTGLNRLELELDGTTVIDGVPTVLASRYSQLPESAKFQPLTGIVQLKRRVPKETEPDQDYPFRFGAGSLFLLVRQEHPLQWPYNAARQTKIYEPRFTLINRRLVRPALNLGVKTQGCDEAAPGTRFCDHIYAAPLPLLLPKFLSEGFAGAHDFTIQALMIDGHGTQFHSNQVFVRYEPNDDPEPFGPSTEAVAGLLASDLLPGLADAVVYHEKSSLQFTEEAKRMKAVLGQDALVALAKERSDLAWLAQLQAFVDQREFFDAAMRATSSQKPERRNAVPAHLKDSSTGRILAWWSSKILQVVRDGAAPDRATMFCTTVEESPMTFQAKD